MVRMLTELTPGRSAPWPAAEAAQVRPTTTPRRNDWAKVGAAGPATAETAYAFLHAARPELHPEPAEQRDSHRAAVHSLLRPYVRHRHHPRGDHHPAPLGGDGRESGPGRGCRHLGGPGGADRGQDLLRHHHPRRHTSALVGRLCHLVRRSWHLG